MSAIEISLSALQVGEPVALANLTMFPLLGGADGEPAWLTLGEALAAGQARIVEVSEAGSVPELRVLNEADRPLLLLDGEELIGAKQNRIVNLTILVAAHSELVIPVSCVEAGRWRHASASFEAGERAFFATGRARKSADVSAAMFSRGDRRSDQGAVWDEISAKAERMRVASPTAAASAMYEANARPLADFVHALAPVPGQCGAAFAVNGKLAGLDVFDGSAMFAKQAMKLVSSYALDAIDETQPDPPAAQETDCRVLLSDVLRARCVPFKAIGLGEDLRIEGFAVRGGALTLEGGVVHLCAFRNEDQTAGATDGPAPRMTRASRRRGMH